MSRPLRIGNAAGFWGDRPGAAADLVARVPDLDVLTLDYLAELSLGIMAIQREKNAAAGYARDFIDVARSLVPFWQRGGRVRVVTNAGGLAPVACAEACRAMLHEAGLERLCIAVVDGDDVLALVRSANAGDFANLETGASLDQVRDRLVTANAYLGAREIAAAIAAGADIVVTGRVADPSLTVGPCVAHHGWTWSDWDRLAGATVAGHVIECGAQATGGMATDWAGIPDLADVGFPIAEVAENGHCVITKPHGSGGAVNLRTVKEQILYEIGDPSAYLSPDVTLSLLSLQLEPAGTERVRISGAAGRPPPDTLKVSAAYRDGHRASAMLTVFGRDAAHKARLCGEVILRRLETAGARPRRTLIECLGAGDVVPGLEVAAATAPALLECVVRVSVADSQREPVERFMREVAPLVASGPAGVTGYAGGRAKVQPQFGYWPCLIRREAVPARWRWCGEPPRGNASARERGGNEAELARSREEPASSRRRRHSMSKGEAKVARNNAALRLGDIAHARSGDKGDSANVAVFANTPADYGFLRRELTAERVAAFFAGLGTSRVERYEVPNLEALNFVLVGALGGGGSRSLRVDAQGKALGQALLELEFEPPADASRSTKSAKLSGRAGR